MSVQSTRRSRSLGSVVVDTQSPRSSGRRWKPRIVPERNVCSLKPWGDPQNWMAALPGESITGRPSVNGEPCAIVLGAFGGGNPGTSGPPCARAGPGARASARAKPTTSRTRASEPARDRHLLVGVELDRVAAVRLQVPVEAALGAA